MFKILSEYLKHPTIYTPSESSFWVDEYISEKLLETHLNPDIDLASRTSKFIDKSVKWIADVVPPNSYHRLLDVGCGPGIYAEKFARIGYDVTGIDFSKRSIEYARNVAIEQSLSITYLHQNYLEMELQETYDLAVMIYCDYGALSTDNRRILMKKIYDRLRSGGRFLLDVCSIRQYEDFEENQTWDVQDNGGFWNPGKFICINSNCKYEDNTTLMQAVVISEEQAKVYYIWNHCFTSDGLIGEAVDAGFRPVQLYKDVAGHPFTEDGKTIAILLEK